MSELLPFLLLLQPPAMESGEGESRGSARTARNTRNPLLPLLSSYFGSTDARWSMNRHPQ
jgi:hypothetical protein